MFKKTRTYQIGSDPRHTVKLTEQEAHVINTIEVMAVDENENLYSTNLTPKEMKIYHRASAKLNAYIGKVGETIPWDVSLYPNVLTLVE